MSPLHYSLTKLAMFGRRASSVTSMRKTRSLAGGLALIVFTIGVLGVLSLREVPGLPESIEAVSSVRTCLCGRSLASTLISWLFRHFTAHAASGPGSTETSAGGQGQGALARTRQEPDSAGVADSQPRGSVQATRL